MRLFRKTAVEHVRKRLWGDLLVIRPPGSGTIVVLFFSIIAAIGLFIYWGQYSLKVSGSGELVPVDGIAKIYTPKAGSVASVFVTEGQLVTKGQRLFSIQTIRTNEDGQEVDQALVNTVRKKLTLVENDRDHQLTRYHTSLSRLEGDLYRNEKLLAEVSQQIAIQQDIIKSFEDILQEAGDLVEKGYIARIEVNAKKERLLNHTQQLASFKRQRIDLENEINRFQDDKNELDAAYQQTLLQLERDALSHQEQLVSLENTRLTHVIAPKGGYVSGIQAIPGSTVNGRVPLVSIVPENQELFAHLYVPARAIGFVKEQQLVKLMFEAYDFRKFGAYDGIIIDITDILFTPAEVPLNITLSEPSYRLTVQLDQQHIFAYGEQLPLKANMRLNADIILASRKLYEWMLDPFTRFGRAT